MSNINDRQTLSDGTVVFHEGQPASRCYLIVQGEVSLFTPHDKGFDLSYTCGSGEFVGINALLDGENYSATAKVKGNATVIPVTQQMLTDQFSKLDKLSLNVIRSVVKRHNILLAEKK